MKLGIWDMGQCPRIGRAGCRETFFSFFVSLPRGKLVKAVVGIGQNWRVAVAVIFFFLSLPSLMP